MQLLEYSDNYSDKVYGSLKEIEVPANNVDLSIDNSNSFKYKATLVGKQQILFITQIVL